MKINAVKLYDNGYMAQTFAFGGEEGMKNFNPEIKYRASLQNFLIDIGDEIILVDTGLPKETPEMIPDETTPIYNGKIIEDYVSAFERLGYKKEDVSKILVTHKHADHTGELRSFPNAEIFISKEDADDLELNGENIIKVEFEDNPYYNFKKSLKITDNIHYIEAKGHTNGNSIVIVEDNDLFYMFHGDVTYTDEALYENKLSVVFEDIDAARETLDNVREFISKHNTIYLSTHTPLGYENLENMKIVDLNNPPESIPPIDDIEIGEGTGKYVCSVCGYTYDPELGDPDNGIPAGTKFEDLPSDWRCPICRQNKNKFNKA